MNFRRTVSLTALLSFLITILTSIILYLVPHGRVAYWANWKLWGLTKDQWAAIHINVGFLFLAALIIHTYYNWKSITLYLQNIQKKISILNVNFLSALALTLFFIVGTYFEVPPLSTIINVSENIKEAAIKKYGEPPYGHAELSSLDTFMKKMDLERNKVLINLKKSGYEVKDTKKTIKDLADSYRISPQKIYFAMTGTKKATVHTGKKLIMPDKPVTGTGNLTLADFCIKYNLNMKKIMRELKERGIKSSETMTLKSIASDNNISPTDLYYRIKEITDKK